jgi:hypothetical protein
MRAVLDGALGRVGEAVDRLDADDGGNRRDLEAPPGVTEVLLHRRNIEPAGDLLRDPDGKAVAGGLKQSTPLDFVPEGLALGFSALQEASAWPSTSASTAFERLWKRDVVGRSVAWVMESSSWLGLGPGGCCNHLLGLL